MSLLSEHVTISLMILCLSVVYHKVIRAMESLYVPITVRPYSKREPDMCIDPPTILLWYGRFIRTYVLTCPAHPSSHQAGLASAIVPSAWLVGWWWWPTPRLFALSLSLSLVSSILSGGQCLENFSGPPLQFSNYCTSLREAWTFNFQLRVLLIRQLCTCGLGVPDTWTGFDVRPLLTSGLWYCIFCFISSGHHFTCWTFFTTSVSSSSL